MMTEQRNVDVLDRWGTWLIRALAVLLFIVMLLTAANLYRDLKRPAPFAFTAPQYAPLDGAICPGDTVRWKPALVVRRTPTVLLVYKSLWSVADQYTVVAAGHPLGFVWTERESGQPVSRPSSYVLPKDLKIGLYEIRVGASALNSDSAAYSVPFVITEACFKKGGKKS